MKYEWQSVEIGIRGCYASVCNTPLHCITIEGDERAWVAHPGLNLTPDGEWIPAPGIEPRPAADEEHIHRLQSWIDELESRLRVANGLAEDLLKEMGFNEEAQKKNSARELIYVYRDIRSADADRAGRHEADCEDAELRIEELQSALQAAEERIVLIQKDCRDAESNLSAIEAWATQPSNNPLLRTAQAHVLKLVRGES